MADFFEDLGKKFTEVTEDLTRKAEDTIEIQKLKSNIRSLERANDRDYKALGMMVFEKVLAEEITDETFVTICSDISKRDEEIAGLEIEISKVKGE